MTETRPLALGDAVWTSSERALDLMRIVATAKEAPVGETPKEVVWRKNKARLFRYVGTSAAIRRTPVFLCLPLINRAYILDLRPGNSFVEFLLGRGHDVFLLDWGTWGPEDRAVTLTDLVTRYLPRAIRHASDEAGGRPLTLLGYCIGGVLATCFAALHPDAPLRNLVLFTTPIDFSDAGQFGTWTAKGAFPIDKIRDTLDVVPAELIDIGAKMLNPAGSTVGTYLQLYERLGDPAFDPRGWQAMYRWVNEGTPFPAAAYHQWITEFYQDNRLVTERLRMAGRQVRLGAIRIPLLNVAASSDTIAPRPTTRAILGKVASRDKSEIVLAGGHVGIVVGRTAKGDLWPRVGDWLAAHDGR
ncbi:MAG: alpha/beta fold hydrolase [Chloroflexota bacterium]|nr:alpha/beta fold hydrolase [Chloroflexota bacterium]